jgi:hypothetical protein
VILVAVLVAAGAVAVVLLTRSTRRQGRVVESIFQDDQLLLYSPAPTVTRTLDTLRSLGVDRLRLTVLWAAIAPDPLSRHRPKRFNASDPASYPAAAWVPYDRIVELARARGLAVDFNVTAPGPLWAMAAGPPNAKAANHYRPSPTAFGQFVAAVGRRYGGSFTASRGAPQRTLPRVSYWTIWNEPNQPGWLWPQWRAVARTRVMNSPRLYRLYVDAAFAALKRTGHSPSTDTILIGEVAPEGSERHADRDAIPPMPFIRSLYCLDDRYQPLRGTDAGLMHCPDGGTRSAFVAAHPGLFDATGFAHHPYSFFLAPAVRMSDENFVPISDLTRLETGLDRIFSAYGVKRTLPIYVTEYGYETNPPDPYRGVSPRLQSAYLNQAQYMAWKDPRVRSFAQFLLVDSAPNPAYPKRTQGYWSSFQTGLVYAGGLPKPSLNSYRIPIFIPDPPVKAGASATIWGMLRPAQNGTNQHALIQWRARRGAYRTLAKLTTGDPSGFLSARVNVPGAGAVRIAWTAPGGAVLHSRAVGVR